MLDDQEGDVLDLTYGGIVLDEGMTKGAGNLAGFTPPPTPVSVNVIRRKQW